MLRFATVASTTLAAGLLLAACGSSSPSSAGNSGAAGNALAFSQCMRANGVPNFPDPPSGSGGGLRIQSSQRAGSGASLTVNGVPVNAPAFQAAQQKCQKDLPSGGHPSAGRIAALRAGALAMAKCMRAHGVTNFPDPVVKENPGGGVSVQIGGAGVDPQSPATESAQNVCGPLMQRAGGPGGPGGPSSTKAAG
jgi:hypothetical protein